MDSDSDDTCSILNNFENIYNIWLKLKECFPYFVCEFTPFSNWISGDIDNVSTKYSQDFKYIQNFEEYFTTELKVTWNLIKNYYEYNDWVIFCYNYNDF
jgi:spore coat polysaccharide biosynthesis protein SpsF (cytidylyltransferase family)